MITWLNFQELLGMLVAMLLVAAGLCRLFSGPVSRYLRRTVQVQEEEEQ